jgi:hypothetical protein
MRAPSAEKRGRKQHDKNKFDFHDDPIALAWKRWFASAK